MATKFSQAKELAYYRSLPSKNVGVGVLLFNDTGELLIVKPNYKDHWSLPSGVVDANESPRAAGLREVKEKTGLELHALRFLCVDFKSQTSSKGDQLQFLFVEGTLSQNEITNIQIDTKELEVHRFVPFDEALGLVSDHARIRLSSVRKAIEQGAIYLEGGRGVI